jgi:uncharacterized delta-60 repeat protein
MRKLWLVLAVLAICGSVWAGPAQAQLDPSFGRNGIVAVNLPEWARGMGAAPDGSSYVLSESWNCTGVCVASNSLFRYTADGRLDQGFGGPNGLGVPRGEQGGTLSLTVDSQGLPLLAEAGRKRLSIRRLTTAGAPDPSFGSDGAVDWKCDCLETPTQILPTESGLKAIVAGYGSPAGLRVIGLRSDGSLDRRYGRRGIAALSLPHARSFTAAAVSLSGAVYLAGPMCCRFPSPLYLARISARGKLDTRFLSTANHSINRFQHLDLGITAVLPRPDGRIDLLGSVSYRKGFVLRLNPGGHLDRRFGRHGLQMLPHPIVSGALGSDGTMLAATDANVFGGGYVLRILPGGRIDPAFVPRRIPHSAGDTGLSIVHLPGRKAMLLDLGQHECRSGCSNDPKLIRYLEPAPSR